MGADDFGQADWGERVVGQALTEGTAVAVEGAVGACVGGGDELGAGVREGVIGGCGWREEGHMRS